MIHFDRSSDLIPIFAFLPCTSAVMSFDITLPQTPQNHVTQHCGPQCHGDHRFLFTIWSCYRMYSLTSRSRNFSHISRIKDNSRISRRSTDLFTSEDPMRSINHKILIFTGKCNKSQFCCSKPKKSSSNWKKEVCL